MSTAKDFHNNGFRAPVRFLDGGMEAALLFSTSFGNAFATSMLSASDIGRRCRHSTQFLALSLAVMGGRNICATCNNQKNHET